MFFILYLFEKNILSVLRKPSILEGFLKRKHDEYLSVLTSKEAYKTFRPHISRPNHPPTPYYKLVYYVTSISSRPAVPKNLASNKACFLGSTLVWDSLSILCSLLVIMYLIPAQNSYNEFKLRTIFNEA